MSNITVKERMATLEANMENVRADIKDIKRDMKTILKISKVLEGQKEKLNNNSKAIKINKEKIDKIETSSSNRLWAVIVLTVGIVVNFLLLFLRRQI